MDISSIGVLTELFRIQQHVHVYIVQRYNKIRHCVIITITHNNISYYRNETFNGIARQLCYVCDEKSALLCGDGLRSQSTASGLPW